MTATDRAGNTLDDSTPMERADGDGKLWAQDLVLEEIGLNNDKISAKTKKCILIIAVGVVLSAAAVLGVVLWKGRHKETATSAPSPARQPAAVAPTTRRPTRHIPSRSPVLDPETALAVATGQSVAQTAQGLGGSPVTEKFWFDLPPYSKEMASNASSPQARALDWLRNDPRYEVYQNLYRLNQRYALAVLYYSTNGASWYNSTGWLSNDTECSWYMDSYYTCDESFRLSTLHLSYNALNGSIPTELELLTDLELLYLYGSTQLSGTIHSEL
jgi:hypothetical protein